MYSTKKKEEEEEEWPLHDLNTLSFAHFEEQGQG